MKDFIIFPTLENSKISERLSLLFLILAFLITIVILTCNIYFFPLLIRPFEFINAGFYFDVMFVCVLFFMLFIIGKIPVYSKYGVYLRVGITIWIAGASFDLSDELVLQPVWIAHYVEDVLRLIGMLVVCISGYKKIKNLEGMYSIANIKAMHDQLTSLPNRRFFMECLQATENNFTGLLLIDIDFFKKINDTYGHDHGDKILGKFGRLLNTYDSENYIPARIGGEEFAVLIRDANEKEMEEFANKIITNATRIVIDKDNNLSVSIGLGIINRNESSNSLIRKTDMALYEAKKNGRGRIEWAP